MTVANYIRYSIKIEPIWWGIIIFFLIVSVSWVLGTTGKNLKKRKERLCTVVLFSYVMLMLSSTVFCRSIAVNRAVDLSFIWKYQAVALCEKQYIVEVSVNVVMFVPVGFLLSTVFTHNLKNVFGISLFISLIIESLQYLTSRGTAELSDLINNAIGAMIGYFLYRFVGKVVSWAYEDIIKK